MGYGNNIYLYQCNKVHVSEMDLVDEICWYELRKYRLLPADDKLNIAMRFGDSGIQGKMLKDQKPSS